MSNDPWASRYPQHSEETFNLPVCELQVSRDLYEVTLAVTYSDDVDWSVTIKTFAPIYELTDAPATVQEIEVALDKCSAEQCRIREAVWQRCRERDDEAAEYRAEMRADARRYWMEDA